MLGNSVGLGSFTDGSLTPVAIAGLTQGVKFIGAGGGYSCAITSSGGVRCWGATAFVTAARTLAPVEIPGLASGVSAISVDASHACAVTGGGAVKCWTFVDAPVDVPGLSGGATAIAAGDRSTCALTSAGGVVCWGSNASGELGNGTKTDSAAPVDVIGLSNGIKPIGAGSGIACAITSGGAVTCWGQAVGGGNAFGTTPVEVPGF